MFLITLYSAIMRAAAWPLQLLLHRRQKAGKEHPTRLSERMGVASLPRPDGRLVWLHAASVGEVQSALIIIQRLLLHFPQAHVLVTTGTVTSAAFIEDKLPDRAMHQFVPLDQPQWVDRFLAHWAPDCVLWMESELWPNMLVSLRAKNIAAILLNARLSDRSAARWRKFSKTAAHILRSFDLILTQTDHDTKAYRALGHQNVHTCGNIKYSAAPLPYKAADLDQLQASIHGRLVWLYASTHDGEEELACHVHSALAKQFPDMLSIVVPRHPERRNDIAAVCQQAGLTPTLRGEERAQPSAQTDIYIADTLGELGLFYRLAPLAVIGRSFSRDGGGGHNPIEAAQLGAGVLSGPHVQYQTEIFDDMRASGAVEIVDDPDKLADRLAHYLKHPDALDDLQRKGVRFAQDNNQVIEEVERSMMPILTKALT